MFNAGSQFIEPNQTANNTNLDKKQVYKNLMVMLLISISNQWVALLLWG